MGFTEYIPKSKQIFEESIIFGHRIANDYYVLSIT